MNLYELIQYIPDFISEMLLKSNFEDADIGKKDGSSGPEMTGKFHLGLQYDINVWFSNSSCGAFPA